MQIPELEALNRRVEQLEEMCREVGHFETEAHSEPGWTLWWKRIGSKHYLFLVEKSAERKIMDAGIISKIKTLENAAMIIAAIESAKENLIAKAVSAVAEFDRQYNVGNQK